MRDSKHLAAARVVGLGVLSLGLAYGSAGAPTPIDVVNHSFEDVAGTTTFNEFNFGPLIGWDLYESFEGQTNGGLGSSYYVGTLTPNVSEASDPLFEFIPGGATDGNRVGIAFNRASVGDGGEYGLVQTSETDHLTAFTRYTLQVDVINIASGTAVDDTFFNLDGFPGYRIDLLAGGVVIASENNSLGGLIPEGGALTSTLIFETGADNPEIGGALGIRLVNLNAVDASAPTADLEVDFDNVRLSSEAVPEPKSLAMLLFAGAMFVRRRRAA